MRGARMPWPLSSSLQMRNRFVDFRTASERLRPATSIAREAALQNGIRRCQGDWHSSCYYPVAP